MENSRSNAPTLQEVVDYANATKSPVDPQKFYWHYENMGWIGKDGKPVTDWKARFRLWTRTETPKKYAAGARKSMPVIDREKLKFVCRVFGLGPGDIGEETYRVLFRD